MIEILKGIKYKDKYPERVLVSCIILLEVYLVLNCTSGNPKPTIRFKQSYWTSNRCYKGEVEINIYH